MFPLGPVMDGMGLNITIMSYRACSTGGWPRTPGPCRGCGTSPRPSPAALTELMEAAGLEPEPFDVPIHLGPGMPPTARPLATAPAGRGAPNGGREPTGTAA